MEAIQIVLNSQSIDFDHRIEAILLQAYDDPRISWCERNDRELIISVYHPEKGAILFKREIEDLLRGLLLLGMH